MSLEHSFLMKCGLFLKAQGDKKKHTSNSNMLGGKDIVSICFSKTNNEFSSN